MGNIKRALIIDDDEINNFICIKNMKDSQFAEQANYCLRGREGLDDIRKALDEQPDNLPDVIFLDINMPLMNAWEFLDEYKTLHDRFPKPVKLFILSSSVYRKDIEKSARYDLVTDYIIKPLSKDSLRQIQEKYFSN
ncbi:MAG: response regulator [Bacteroidia bacterium]|nr:response regulator [Bacteroidia bacterium]